MGIKTAIVGGMVGYGLAKWLDGSKTGRTVANVGAKLIDAGLTRFHEMTQQAAAQDQAARVPNQPPTESPFVRRAEEWASKFVNGGQQ